MKAHRACEISRRLFVMVGLGGFIYLKVQVFYRSGKGNCRTARSLPDSNTIELPRVGYRLPKAILSQNEVERILNEPELKTSNGVRDRAIMEVLYSTGMRRMELCNLKLYDLDFEGGTVMIRKGKGKKDRLVPIGERAISFVLRYLKEVRPELVMEPDEKYVFLSKISERFTPDRLSGLVRNYVRKSGVEKQGSCHLFRHTCATLMLENGADIRFIQEILGHVKLDTTQIYTRVSITKLKEIHTATHPAKASRSDDLSDTLDIDEDSEL